MSYRDKDYAQRLAEIAELTAKVIQLETAIDLAIDTLRYDLYTKRAAATLNILDDTRSL